MYKPGRRSSVEHRYTEACRNYRSSINDKEINSFQNDKSEKNWNFAVEAKKADPKAYLAKIMNLDLAV